MHSSASLMGRLGSDPDIKYTSNGEAVCNVSVAVDQYDREAEPDWWRLTLWGKQAEFAATYLAKGCRVYVEGRPGLDEWEGEDGGHHAKLALTVRTIKAIDWAEGDGWPAEPEADRSAPRPAASRSRPKPEATEPKAAARQGKYRAAVARHGRLG
jgi:single-strand DNA-binding protein